MIQKLQEAFQCRNNGDNEKAKSLIKEYIKEAAVAIMAKKLNEAKGANQFSGSVGEVLTRHQNELNSIKDNRSLVAFLEGLKDEVKGEEPSAYLTKLIAEVKRTPSFNRNFQHVYNIILAGDGLSSINEEVEEEDLDEAYNGDIDSVRADYCKTKNRDVAISDLLDIGEADTDEEASEIVDEWDEDLDEAVIPTEDKVETLVDEIKADKEEDVEEEDLDAEEIDLDDETAEELDDEELVDLDDEEEVPAEETTEVIPTEDAIETVEDAAEESEVVDTDEEMKELTSKFEELAAEKAVEVPAEDVEAPVEEEIPAEKEAVEETSEEEAVEEPVETSEEEVAEEPAEETDQDEVDIMKFIK